MGMRSIRIPISRVDLLRLTLTNQRQHYVQGEPLRPVHSLRSFLIVRSSRVENVLNPLLRIPVVQREPRALHLHHNAMALQKCMIVGMQADPVGRDLVHYDRLRTLKALAKPPAQDFTRHHYYRCRFCWSAHLMELEAASQPSG